MTLSSNQFFTWCVGAIVLVFAGGDDFCGGLHGGAAVAAGAGNAGHLPLAMRSLALIF